MEAKRAIEILKQLKSEAETRGMELRPSGEFSSWKGRVRSVLIKSLGKDHHLMADFENVRYSLMAYASGTPQSSFDAAFMRGIRQACGIIDAAIFELEESGTSDDAVDETAFDPDLWAHVQSHIQNEEWQKVASQTAIFVEDRVRRWCGEPRGNNGQVLVGKGLFAAVLANDGQYRLGKEPGEWEGWRALGMGFAQALSNVDRHNIQKRDDAKRYAFGVLGIGSLILTQLRHQHGEDLYAD
ncbi:TIGR02391 family protein [Streptomyces cinerochromogenes]|uniref:TIGR02391 family protein n=1 Tax=Streptomyces cinerochromogenes TaxID=66422 RepID=A0ABW7B2P1_9ACTN